MVKGSFIRSNSGSKALPWSNWILAIGLFLGFLFPLVVSVQGYSEEYAEPQSMAVRQFIAQHRANYYPGLYSSRVSAPYLRRIPLMGTNKRFDVGDDPRVTRKLVARNEGGAKSNDHQKLLVYRMFKRGGQDSGTPLTQEENEFPFYLNAEKQGETLL
ncbi:hypothetical protein TCAL_12725 [Tigriopus californicus]|uniref:Uncharacterized protein n=1 Tax=Tigriopus californicus TaxID=6832 RepID=A0A553PSC1_TIGCA|nr:uncharacterized protein LOC131892009 [Tigriopus californicus]TRY80579.1 hypothetical protein TCAL_12725 [Tigriopus californicus]|eukprot:TCALIF_12725-PA protein Name:"Protein of unknown function" AED:0.00 eAED:0.00 QI:44/1/1/1/0.33/0.5/4/449/157